MTSYRNKIQTRTLATEIYFKVYMQNIYLNKKIKDIPVTGHGGL
jgi:hypothetical protein